MNPTFWVEATAATRRPRIYWIRFLYGGLLFAVMLSCATELAYRDTDYVSLRESSALFAATFFNAFAWVQTLGVLIVCPAIFAGAIAGDRERGVLDHMLATDLSSREIVFGKLAARLLESFHLVAVAFPILSLAMLLGGIRDDVLTMSFLVAGALILSIAGVSVFISTTTPKSRDAVTRVYMLGALTFVLLPIFVAMIEALVPGVLAASPISLAWLFNAIHPLGLLTSALAATVTGVTPPWEDVWAFVAFHSVVFVVGVTASVWALRRVEFAASARSKRARAGRGMLESFRPYLEHDPVLWKDVTLEHSSRWGGRIGMIVGWLLVACVLLSAGQVFVTAPISSATFVQDGFYLYTASINVTLGCVAVLTVAIRASCAITSEAEKDTLTVMMSTPLPAEEILWSKLLASLYGGRGLLALMGINAGLSIIRAPLSVVGHLGALLALAIISLALGAIALWISTTAKSSVNAIIKTVILCVVLGGAYLFCGMCCLFGGGGGGESFMFVLAPCIPFLLATPYFWLEWSQYSYMAYFATPFVMGMIGYAVAGFVCFSAAAADLDRRYRAGMNLLNR